ncbi:MAG: carbohydrate-binding family 6 protein [Acidobacteria bacterium]|nr:carbohydrate-binding family 6 protein [Acidobacteriota bacterium]
MMLFHIALLASGFAGAQPPQVPTKCAWPCAMEVAVYFDGRVPPARFAAGEIRRALAARRTKVVERNLAAFTGANGRPGIVLDSGRAGDSQTYTIRKRAATYLVQSSGGPGAMYGGLDIAEAIRLGTLASLKEGQHVPHIARRGIKFNIPLDARTPSYSDAGDSAQQNIPEMWSMAFWTEFLDEMARDRYNVLTLWSLNPFPSLVKVPEYPDVALSDVKRTTVRFEDQRHNGTHMGSPEIFAHLETIKKISIGEKIRFWRDVMQYAHDRGIEVYLFTWNIFTFGEAGKYGITSDQTNTTTIDYFRKSVREVILTYPLLAGIGITAGENMPVKDGEFSKEKWLWKTYGEGIRDALKRQPKRQFRLIHRQHQTSLKTILNEWKDLPATFDMSYKYSVAHMYSYPAPPFAKKDILDEMPASLRLWMTVRNDDIYSFRWGDPAYARAYVRNLPGPDKMIGFYMGPDGYTWGREFISREPETPRELVIKKQWYSFMLWGRLSFDPSLPDALFERALAVRFPEVPAAKLYAASSYASRLIPRATTFNWGPIDIRWFPEACSAHAKLGGFYSVERFMKGQSMPGAGVLNISDYLRNVLDGQHIEGMTPPQVAAELQSNAARALQLVGEMRPVKSKELRYTLGDYEAMAHLGNYYAEKILGSTDLALFDRTGNPQQKESAVRHLRAALEHWKKYAAAATAQYKPQLLTRLGDFDLNRITRKVEQDISTAEAWRRH